MWHLPLLQTRRMGQMMNVFQNVFKRERAESWVEELSIGTKECKVF